MELNGRGAAIKLLGVLAARREATKWLFAGPEAGGRYVATVSAPSCSEIATSIE